MNVLLGTAELAQPAHEPSLVANSSTIEIAPKELLMPLPGQISQLTSRHVADS